MIYFLGIGPGDPELITVKACRLLKEADVIYVPQSNEAGRSVAEKIIAPHADTRKIQMAYTPMSKDQKVLSANYTALARTMSDDAAKGRMVVYVTLGDNMIYSTSRYIGQRLSRMDVAHEFVPGVPSYVAAANHTEISLADHGENLLVVPMPTTSKAVAELVHTHHTVFFMKVSMRTPALVEYVKTYKPEVAVLIHRLQLDGEEIIDLTRIDEAPENIGYLSMAIVKEEVSTNGDQAGIAG